MERAREAGDRRALFAEFGIPPATPYRYIEVWRPEPGGLRARYGVVRPDGALTVEHERRVKELPGESWPPRLQLTSYGVEPTDAVLLGMGRVRQQAQLPLGPAGGPILISDPEGWESWGTTHGLLWLRLTGRDGDSPLAAERRRRIDRKWDDGVTGLQAPHSREDVVRAEAVLRHLRTWEELRGRRQKQPGAGVPTTEEFLRSVDEHFGTLWANEVVADTVKQFIANFGMSYTAFYAAMKRARRDGEGWVTWANLKSRFRRSALTGNGRTNRNDRRGRRE